VNKAKKNKTKIALYIPDYAPIVVKQSDSEDDSEIKLETNPNKNAFDYLEELIKISDYFFIGDELYIPYAKEIKGDENVFQAHPFIDKSENPVDMKIDSKINSLFYDKNYFAKNRYVLHAKEYVQEMQNFFKNSDLDLIQTKTYENVDGDSTFSNIMKENPFHLCVNNRYLSQEYIPRRYLSVLAHGGHMFTNYTKSINKYFYSQMIYHGDFEIENQLKNYNEEDLFRFRCENIIYAHLEFSTRKFYEKIFGALGVVTENPLPKIYVILDERDKDSKYFFDAQTYENKEIISLSELNEKLPLLREEDFVTYFKSGNAYGRLYLSDLMAALLYSDSECATKKESGKASFYRYGKGDIFLENSVAKIKKIKRAPYHLEGAIQTEKYFQLSNCFINDKKRKTKDEKKVGIIVPVYNNGKQLYYRNFRSILRSSVFDKFRVYLIDDGSSNAETINIIKEIGARYDNVKTYFFEKGGSGAAGRPRNKGIEICEEEYAAFEDPDDESVNNSYKHFLGAANERDEYDLISAKGHYITFHDGKKKIETPIVNEDKLYEEKNFNNEFPEKKEKFQIARRYTDTHISMIKKDFLVKNNLRFIEKHTSEDNLLALEILDAKPNTLSVNIYKCAYFAENDDSVTRTKGIENLFEKWEKGTIEVLKNLGRSPKLTYMARNIIREANDFSEVKMGLNRLRKLYEDSGLNIFDEKEEWFRAFVFFNASLNNLNKEYFSDMKKLFNNFYFDFSDRDIVPIIADAYPSENNIYANGFIQTRVLLYKKMYPDLSPVVLIPSHENKLYYQKGIPVLRIKMDTIPYILRRYYKKKYMLHFLRPAIYSILHKHLKAIKLLIYAHGYEIQKFKIRRKEVYENSLPLQKKYIEKDDKTKEKFWKGVFSDAEKYNMEFVFVSKILCDEIFSDFKYSPEKIREKIKVIHNVIDTALFSFQKKTKDMRKKILLIRPFASEIYANDLAVKAILYLKELRPDIFTDMVFDIFGKGVMFDKLTSPLKGLPNINLHNKFISHEEIKKEHDAHGLFLVPTRGDSQGVSRDEAMSSGLVPLTNVAGSIPEFVDESCAMLAPYNDYKKLTEGMIKLYEDEELFLQMSRNASDRVRELSSPDKTIKAEIEAYYGKN
jgi:glycosyltransferase involved in cell wall biosynthesis